MQRSWQLLCDRWFPGFTLMAGTVVDQLDGARTINGWTAVRVVDPPHRGRVLAMRVESASSWLNVWPVERPEPQGTCSHGAPADRPWTCAGCTVAAVAVGLGDYLPLPAMPGLPVTRTYFEAACERWGEATGRLSNVNLGRLHVEAWMAHAAGKSWPEWCRDARAELEGADRG